MLLFFLIDVSHAISKIAQGWNETKDGDIELLIRQLQLTPRPSVHLLIY